MSGELAKRGGCRSVRFLSEQMNTSVVEGRRMRFRGASPISTFLGISRCLDVAVVEAHLSICGRSVEGLLGSKSGLW